MKKILFALLFLPLFLSAMTEKEKENFWFKSPEMTLYRKRNRGLMPQAVMKSAQYKIPSPRKAPEAALRSAAASSRKGNVDFRKVPVSLKEEAGVDRTAWTRFGLPLPQGAVFNTKHLRITDPAGKEIPSQVSVTGFWPDNSVKWAFIRFAAPLKAGEEKVFYAEFGNRVKAAEVKGITFSETEDTLTVDTGKIKAVIDKKKFNLIKSVYRKNLRLGNFNGVVMKNDKTGYSYRLTPRPPESFVIAEKGPLCLALRVAGEYRTGNAKDKSMSYVARLFFYAGSEAVDIEYSHINTDISREFTDVRSLNIEFLPADKTEGIKTGLSSAPVKRIFQETDQYYSLDNGKRLRGEFSGSAVTVSKRPIAFGTADAWQRYPKALSCKDNRILVELLPQQPGNQFNRDLPYYLVYPFCEGAYRIKWGMGFTERIRFDFSGTDVGPELNKPVISVLPRNWYAVSGVFPGFDAPGFDAVDKKILASFRNRQKQSKAQREFGYFNYGDSFGEKRVNWTNNEYDMAHGLFTTFLRTGDRSVFRAALAAARHQADVDICRAYPDPYYVGGNFSHRGVHNGRYKRWSGTFNKYHSASNGHTWVWGMLNAWHLYGDAQVMDAALLLGDHIALAMVPNYKMDTYAPAPRECGWAMKALGKLYESTGDKIYLDAMKKLAMVSLNAGKKFEHGLWVFKNPRLLEEWGQDVWSNAVFVTGIALMSFCEYYELSGDETVKPFIRTISDRILAAFAPAEGCGFAYDVDPTGKKLRYSVVTLNFCIASPLAQAAVILKDPVLFDTAQKAMAAGLLRYPGFSGKFLAEYTCFLTGFLSAHARFPRKYQLDFQEKSMLDLVHHTPESTWNWRAPAPGVFLVKLLKEGKHTLRMQRWVTNYRIKTKNSQAGIILKDARGNILKKHSFDSGRGTLDAAFELTGKKGDVFEISVTDTPNGDWCILPSENFAHGAVMPKKQWIRLARCGMTKLYFKLPAGKEGKIRFYGTHSGPFGLRLFDEKGVLIKSLVDHQEKNAISTAPVSQITLPVGSAAGDRILSVSIWAETDAKLRIENAAVISGGKAFFSR